MTSAAQILDRIKHLDLYLKLEAPPEATEEEIKKAYRKMAKKCHPDKNPENPRATQDFQLLSDAYTVLSDRAVRADYDRVFKARKARKWGKKYGQGFPSNVDDLINKFADLAVKSSKHWTMAEHAAYKAEFKNSGKETKVLAAKAGISIPQFERWVGFKPSSIGKKESIKEVIVMWPGLTEESMLPVSEKDLREITATFERQRSKGDRTITRKFLKNLGLKHSYTLGKWMIMIDEEHTDKIWQALGKGLLLGYLPDCIISIKLKLEDLRGKANNSNKINVYTEDFSNEEDVRKAEDGIIEHLFRSGISMDCIQVMKYKAELYTHVGIFAKNKFGGGCIPPSMYTGRHVRRRRY